MALMPENLSMCKNFRCPSKGICYRYRAKPSSNQLYVPYDYNSDGKCFEFWDCRDYVEKNLQPVDKYEDDLFYRD